MLPELALPVTALSVAGSSSEPRVMPARAARKLPQPTAAQLAACRNGDPDGFAWLFRSYRDHVFSLALHVCGNRSDAGDVTQEVFLKLLTRIGQFREDARFTTWLYRVVMNTALDHHRSRRAVLAIDDPLAEPPAAPPTQERDAHRSQVRRRVREELARLKPEFRAALVLRFAAELSYEEIADLLGVSKGTIASRLNRGLRQLGRELAPLESEDA